MRDDDIRAQKPPRLPSAGVARPRVCAAATSAAVATRVPSVRPIGQRRDGLPQRDGRPSACHSPISPVFLTTQPSVAGSMQPRLRPRAWGHHASAAQRLGLVNSWIGSMVSSAPRNWQLHPLLSGDADAVSRLVKAAFARMELPLTPPPGALSETAHSIAERIHRGGGAGATVDGALVGSVLWAVDEGLYVSRLAVSPAWRRCGIGASLLDACEMEARRRGQVRLHLETRFALAGNLRLFAKLGYREFARNPPAGDPQITLVKLEKPIR